MTCVSLQSDSVGIMKLFLNEVGFSNDEMILLSVLDTSDLRPGSLIYFHRLSKWVAAKWSEFWWSPTQMVELWPGFRGRTCMRSLVVLTLLCVTERGQRWEITVVCEVICSVCECVCASGRAQGVCVCVWGGCFHSCISELLWACIPVFIPVCWHTWLQKTPGKNSISVTPPQKKKKNPFSVLSEIQSKHLQLIGTIHQTVECK